MTRLAAGRLSLPRPEARRGWRQGARLAILLAGALAAGCGTPKLPAFADPPDVDAGTDAAVDASGGADGEDSGRSDGG